jgi:hypothetical protein
VNVLSGDSGKSSESNVKKEVASTEVAAYNFNKRENPGQMQ